MTLIRPEQLNLQADPAFNIDLDLGFDLSSFDISFSTDPSSVLSPRTLASSESSFLDDENFLGPAPPLDVSSSHGAGGGFEFTFDDAGPEAENDRDRLTDQPSVRAEDEGHNETAMPDLNQEENLLDIAEDGTIILRDASDRGTILSDPPALNDDLATEDMQGVNFELMGDADDMDRIDIVSGHYSRNDPWLNDTAKSSALLT